MTPLLLAFDLALGDNADATEWLTARTGLPLRVIAAEASEILGRPISYNTIDNWLTTITKDTAAS